MASTQNTNNSPDPLENLKKLIEFLAAIVYRLFTKGVLIFGIGSLLVIFILYMFFKLFGF